VHVGCASVVVGGSKESVSETCRARGHEDTALSVHLRPPAPNIGTARPRPCPLFAIFQMSASTVGYWHRDRAMPMLVPGMPMPPVPGMPSHLSWPLLVSAPGAPTHSTGLPQAAAGRPCQCHWPCCSTISGIFCVVLLNYSCIITSMCCDCSAQTPAPVVPSVSPARVRAAPGAPSLAVASSLLL